ncbi:hypothetical protein PAHAL_3G476500 [Panicum hallii]|uniref:Uncharacterized protein n=1 Tax=Panicum hallii TaxID=206008 RepID=A0A2T8KLT8_9POAL|nr:hypothetical protein PAHAL_3G476500 [Panicum hallii]
MAGSTNTPSIEYNRANDERGGLLLHGRMVYWNAGPDILPSCFSKDRFSVGPDFKKLEKRFAAAQSRSTAAKPVTFAAAQSRLTAVKPDMHDKGIRLKRIRDHDDMQMEELEAKRMKLKAVFSQVIESRKKKLMGSLTMKEGAMSAIGV